MAARVMASAAGGRIVPGGGKAAAETSPLVIRAGSATRREHAAVASTNSREPRRTRCANARVRRKPLAGGRGRVGGMGLPMVAGLRRLGGTRRRASRPSAPARRLCRAEWLDDLENDLSSPAFLIVEDHAFQRSMLEQLLRGLGAEVVHCAANGKEAMRLLQDATKHVDIVVSDLMMPDVDGIELLPALRRSSRSPALVLVSAASVVLPAAEAIAIAQGITVLGTLEKPVTVEKLKPLLERYAAGAVKRS